MLMHRPQHKQAPAPAGDHIASLQEPALHRGTLCGESQRGRLCERGASRRHGDGQLQDGCLQRLEHGALLVCKGDCRLLGRTLAEGEHQPRRKGSVGWRRLDRSSVH